MTSLTGSSPAYEYEHVVTYEETNAVGNVYFATYFKWQGLVRERFLHERAPSILEAVDSQHPLVTVDASCTFLDEVWPFDALLIRMYADQPVQNRLTLRYEFWRRSTTTDQQLVARGQQTVAWMDRSNEHPVPIRVPQSLVDAIDLAIAESCPTTIRR